MMTTGDTRSTIPPTPMTLVVVGEPDDDDEEREEPIRGDDLRALFI